MNSNSNNYKKQKEHSNFLPFNIQWLDSSYQQTCLPDNPWQKVKNLLNKKSFI